MMKDLTKDQFVLAEYMSSLSESAFSAGWMDGLEKFLWQIVLGQRNSIGRLKCDQDMINKLKDLSVRAGGWIYYDGIKEETFVPFEIWQTIFESENKNKI